MKESYRKGKASHQDPESCGCGRKTSAEALTGAHAGQLSVGSCTFAPCYASAKTVLRLVSRGLDDFIA